MFQAALNDDLEDSDDAEAGGHAIAALATTDTVTAEPAAAFGSVTGGPVSAVTDTASGRGATVPT